jgi:hypothetical protein
MKGEARLSPGMDAGHLGQNAVRTTRGALQYARIGGPVIVPPPGRFHFTR